MLLPNPVYLSIGIVICLGVAGCDSSAPPNDVPPAPIEASNPADQASEASESSETPASSARRPMPAVSSQVVRIDTDTNNDTSAKPSGDKTIALVGATSHQAGAATNQAGAANNEPDQDGPAPQPPRTLDSQSANGLDRSGATIRPQASGPLKSPAPPQRFTQTDVDPNQPSDTDEDDRWRQWPRPRSVLFFTGQQHGYIEPCGCTGLENQKGGLARRFTLIKQLQAMNWEVLPMDVGNQVKRAGAQAGIKFQTTIESLRKLGYRVVGIGPDDLRLDVGALLAEAAPNPGSKLQFVSGNVTLLDPTLMPRTAVVTSGGKRIGVTSILDPGTIDQNLSEEITVNPVVPALKQAVSELAQANCDFNVLMFFGGNSAQEFIKSMAPNLSGIDLVVISNEFGEPIYKPQAIPDCDAKLIITGHKAMYACLIALYDDRTDFRYARIPLTDSFDDAPEMLQSLASYQDHLKNLGFQGLGLKPIPHPSGSKFVGSEKCGECHTTAFGIWEKTPHAHATTSIVKPPNDRGSIARHFDPECLSCHVTGWNPQGYYPYLGGYESLQQTPHLVANGCENCHGPGSQHAAAEDGEIDASDEMIEKLRQSMRLPLERSREKCMECHDLDNSPDFHKEGAFEKYWNDVKHEGMN